MNKPTTVTDKPASIMDKLTFVVEKLKSVTNKLKTAAIVSTTAAIVSTTVTEKLKSVYKNSQFRGWKSEMPKNGVSEGCWVGTAPATCAVRGW
jgi:hypothetical protein